MNFEPKKTDKAAFVSLWHNGELLVLQSRKWREEGMPYLLPGGGWREDETEINCVVREVKEEIGHLLYRGLLRHFGNHKTEWSNCVFFEYEARQPFEYFIIESKLSAVEWWNFVKDRKRIEVLKPFMMPGLKWYLEQKGLL